MTDTSVEILNLVKDKLTKYFAATPEDATPLQLYKAVALVTRDVLLNLKQDNNKRVAEGGYKRVYYLCMEFLLGRSMKNNLYNLGLEDAFAEALRSVGVQIDDLYAIELDAGLGNGGLGRLAACFMDSLATLNYPAMGFSIRYEYGLFRQKIVDDVQVEMPDLWLDTGEVWMMPRSDKNFKVHLGGHVSEWWDEDGKCRIEYHGGETVEAIPYDVMIGGKDSKGVSVLRLWRATAARDFDMKSFTQGDYMMAMRADNEAELISKVLYPSDDHFRGKQLRLSQQYFLVSASLQSIFKDHLKQYGTLDNISEKAAIHINDTHPALAVPEMMRLLVDENGYSWERAWEMTTQTMAYTNHTVMSEALEKWSEELIATHLPRIYKIIREIDRRFTENMYGIGLHKENVEHMCIIYNGQVRMAPLSIIGSHSVNGVSALHSDIIKNSIFNDFYKVTPDKFVNVTNGIAHRRWLNQSNPELAALITDLIGDGFVKDASRLSDLEKFANDKSVLKKLGEIKLKNKQRFSKAIDAYSGFSLDPDMRFDTQIKRLHEYKRQLMNVLKILYLYLELKDNPNMDMTPQTFIFGAKAAGGYYHAKRIISLINCISRHLKEEPAINKKLNVLFVENYNVTAAEKLIPASEVSEQISLAGKEASGTSNMKFMLNGAITLGTVDGANVEIGETVGENNIFSFGLKTEEVDKAWRDGYSASLIYAHNPKIRRVVDLLKKGCGGESFADIASYLTIGTNGIADPYMCLLDFDDYLRAYTDMDKAYRDEMRWNKMSLINIARSGVFAADRSITEYAKNIWGLRRVDEK